jgi:hypothetical protein
VVMIYLALNGAMLAMNVAGAGAFSYIWVPFGFLAWWILARRRPVRPFPRSARARADGRIAGSRRPRGP